MTAIAHAISAALLHFVWQGMVIAFLLWLALTTLRNNSPQLRYLVSCVALGIMVALPLITVVVLYQAPSPATTRVDQIVSLSSSANLPRLPERDWLTTWIAALEAFALPMWCAGVVACAIRLIWSTRYVARLRNEGEPASGSLVEIVARLSRRMNIGRPARVLISRLADCPSVIGWLRPVILVPAGSILNLTTAQLEAVIAHELAHIKRFDYLVNVVQSLVEMLLFYHPAVWWASARMRHERELCCDDLAVEVSGDAVGYARALAKLERARTLSPELAVGSTSGHLLYRIQRLTAREKAEPPSKLPAFLALCLAVCCLFTNLPWAHAQQQNGREVEVSKDAIWVDTVKFGELPILVRALGKINAPETAELKIPTPQANEVQVGQGATLDLRRGILAEGKVSRVQPYAMNGMSTVTIGFRAPLPEFVGQDVDGTIRIKTLNNVVYVGRPAGLHEQGESTVFQIEADGQHAKRVRVRFGTPSVNTIQVLEGLQPGDRLILSDISQYVGVDRITLK